MPWLSNMLLDGLFVAQDTATPGVATPGAATPGVAAPANATNPESNATPGVLATPAGDATPGTPSIVATPAAPGTPGQVATPGAPGTPTIVVTPEAFQTPVAGQQQQIPGNPPVDFQPYQQGLSGGQWTMLILFAGVCIGLITCVLFQNSKSDGLGGMLGGGGGMGASTFKGKKSSEERLSQVTTYFATAFILCSLGMAIMFK